METTTNTKHLINGLEESVRENLLGSVLRNGNLQLLKDGNIVVKKDFKNSILAKNKVALISGGGSGHEPFGVGAIGEGMLTAVVAGNIFAAPSARNILKAIRVLGSKDKDSAGVLLILNNYTGDRLNFGLAQERALLEGYKVGSVIFGEDSAFHEIKSSAGRRGLAGVVLLIKIAGALADQFKGFDYIKAEIEKVAQNIRTISVSLTACNIPGVGLSFILPNDELEVGLGIHGEAGIERIKMRSAMEAVELMLNFIERDAPWNRSEMNDVKIALLINNLGGLSTFEINIITKEAISQLQAKGFCIERVYCGAFITSFNMCGVSITVCRVDEHILHLLDAPCASEIWQNCISLPKKPNSNETAIFQSDSTLEIKSDCEIIDSLPFARSEFLTAVETACVKIMEAESYLNDLDSEAGDSDCGSTLSNGAKAILNCIRKGALQPSFLQLAHIVEEVMGGTSGAIYSLLFTGASSVVSNVIANRLEVKNKVHFWYQAVDKGMDLISKYSLAQVGDRTMLDSLNALRTQLVLNENSTDYSTLARKIAEAVDEAANSTINMKARAGRASYVNQERLTKADPGAKSIAIWVKAIASLFLEQ
ncbi:bifunctional ATP-dependent dihydroxyacetone kinase/FAD-AMP lyase (cyclizing)-like protein [Dinothrombium tinctorium]|uniref:Triokinase/FMN cyclase n=1 Tax=Dinothrombium tinctorium TaxID=1965070 RepID=A0A3S3NVM9_9ACAR|nr:bifunctional ATP-dependent dihydroxyacetone kinase/FAD-AMP lyase (cyclizing)-like protein [Dinothrombium tinctorium]RWS02760.1 bifunctional ATP-dependent dihydroxyacetone kinase/FAD-AMP lyase (cyclizing)-like protein [Dinothrombium tinctorium]